MYERNREGSIVMFDISVLSGRNCLNLLFFVNHIRFTFGICYTERDQNVSYLFRKSFWSGR